MALYVGNVSYSISEQDLEQIFADYGTVKSVKLIKDRDTGRSKGFAFIELEDEDDEDKAINELNGKAFSGRNLKINKARPKEENNSRRY